MGESLQSFQAKQFKHHRDKSFEQEFKQNNLFSKCPEVCNTTYRCIPTSPEVIVAEGDCLIARPHAEIDNEFQIIRGSQVIGKIEGSCCEHLRRACENVPLIKDIFLVTVVKRSALTSIFDVTLCSDINGDDHKESKYDE